MRGYQVLSFDLSGHGDRKIEAPPYKVENYVHDLKVILEYAQLLSKNISVFACSMGAYFSLLAYEQVALKQALFLSPVVDMGRIIHNMMTWFNVSEEKLEIEKEVSTPIGETLYWDYYCYVKAHPIVGWNHATAILYGSEDNLCEFDVLSDFAMRFKCDLVVMAQGEHYFHTEEQLQFFRQWVIGSIFSL